MSLPRAVAQQAPFNCPGAFAGQPLKNSELRFNDGIGIGSCDYGKPQPPGSTVMFFNTTLRWVENGSAQEGSALCGPTTTTTEQGGIPSRGGGGFEVNSNGKQAFIQLFGDYVDDPSHHGEVEAFGRALLAQVEPFTVPLPCHGVAADHVTCIVTVKDRVGRPVQGAHTSLELQKGRLEGVTDIQGSTQFPNVEVGTSVIAEVTLEDAEHDPRQFRIEFNDTPASARTRPTPVVKGSTCDLQLSARGPTPSLDSDVPGPQKWADEVEIYQRVHQAMRLANQLGPVKYGLPLRVHTFCTSSDFQCAPGKDNVFALEGRVGSQDFSVSEPFIAIGEAWSLLSNNSRPDNREYHEMGHWFQANLLGGVIPIACQRGQDCTHKGYFVNTSSNDSYVEGFATFFSMMVSKHIDLRSYPELFRFYGSYMNLERNKLAWEAAGRYEEFAVAGVLLDMEDGPNDYTTSAAQQADLALDCCNVGTDVAEGFVSNQAAEGTGATAKGVHVIATLPDGTKKDVPTIPSDIPPQGAARVVIPAAGVPTGTHLTAKVATGPTNGNDDDQVTVRLKTLLQAIASGRGAAGGPIATVTDLHDVLKSKFGGDKNGNGIDDVDEIFIDHGFFDDPDGDLTWKTGDAVGPTAHPASQQGPAITPRPHADAPRATRIPVETGRPDAQVLVDVAYPPKEADKSFAVVAQPDPDDHSVFVDMPPPGSGATVTLVAVAPDAPPALAGRITSDDFWTKVEQSPDQPAARFRTPLKAAATNTSVTSSGDSYSAAGVGVAAIVLGGALLLFILRPPQRRLAYAGAGLAALVLVWSFTAGGTKTKPSTATPPQTDLAAATFDAPLGASDQAGSSSSEDVSTTTTPPSTSTSPAIAPGGDLTAKGTVSAESTAAGSAAALAVDGDPGTSWFSGPAAGDDGAIEFTWKSDDHFDIGTVRVTPTRAPFRSFTSVEIILVAGEGDTVFDQTVPISTLDDIVVHPNVKARAIDLVFRGYEDPDGGSGFAELHIEAP